MFTLEVTNEYDQTLSLTQNPAYSIKSISGLDPPEASINKTKLANSDGSEFNSAFLNDRQIIITMAIESPAELNRNNLYTYLKSKKKVKIHYKNGIRDVYTEGIIQKVDVSFFEKKEIAQITIDCVNPYFLNEEDSNADISAVQALFEFPFMISEPIPFSEIEAAEPVQVINKGNDQTGVIITLTAYRHSVAGNISITNLNNNMTFKINRGISAGDQIVVNSIRGEKSLYYISNGVKTNILNSMDRTSQWIVLEPGINRIVIEESHSEEAEITAEITFTPKYQGV